MPLIKTYPHKFKRVDESKWGQYPEARKGLRHSALGMDFFIVMVFGSFFLMMPHWVGLAVFTFLAGFLYPILTIRGCTPGQYYYSIRVRNRDHSHLGLLKAFARYYLMIIFFVPTWVSELLSEDSVMMHDEKLGTRVFDIN